MFICFPFCKAVAQGTGHGPFHIYGRDSGQPCPAQRCRPLQTADKTVKAKDLSLRGGRRPTWRPEREARGSALGVQSRSTRLHRGKVTGEIATAFPRLPRRFAPRNDTSGSAVVYQRPPTVELPCTGRSLSAATVKFDSDCVRRHSVYIGSAFPRLPRPLWGLAMTIRGCIPFSR